MKIDNLINLIYSDYKLDPEGAIEKLKKARKTYFWMSLIFFVGFACSLFLFTQFIATAFNFALFVVAFINIIIAVYVVADLSKIVRAIKIVQSLIDNRGGKG